MASTPSTTAAARQGVVTSPEASCTPPGTGRIVLVIVGGAFAVGLGLGLVGQLAPSTTAPSDAAFDDGYRAGVRAGFQLGTVCTKRPSELACADAELIRQGVL